MKKHRPDSTMRRMYVETADKLMKISEVLDVDGIIIMAQLVNDKYEKVCRNKKLSPK